MIKNKIKIKNGKLVALLSYQDTSKINENFGYDNIEIPINLRDIQLSSRGSILINQSVSEESLIDNMIRL